jgi:hypothetical protein
MRVQELAEWEAAEDPKPPRLVPEEWEMLELERPDDERNTDVPGEER